MRRRGVALACALVALLVGAASARAAAFPASGIAHGLAPTLRPPGAQVDLGLHGPLTPRTDRPPPADADPLDLPSYFSEKTDQVARTTFYFSSVYPEVIPVATRLLPPFRLPTWDFVPQPHVEDRLEELRARDRLLLFQGRTRDLTYGVYSAVVFGGMVVVDAHSPARFLFDERLHFGPSIFDDTGLGGAFGFAW